MFYTVECTYLDPASEDEWNAFYSQEKLPALISVSGFCTSQRFKALTAGCPVYLAIHTIRDAGVITSDEYRLKGGGNFARWQPYISDWHRHLYEGEGAAPLVSADQILLISLEPLRFVEIELGYHPVEMRASWREKSSTSRLAYVLPREKTVQLAAIPGAYLYQPLTVQLQNPTAITPRSL